MRVTFVITSLGCGGAERVLAILANYWAEKNWAITVVTLDHPGVEPFYTLHEAIGTEPLDLIRKSRNAVDGALANVKRLLVLRSALKHSTPDVVISFMDTTNILTLLAAVGLRIPVVISERVDPSACGIGFFWSTLRKLVYPLARHLVVQTEVVLAFFSLRMRGKTTVIPNPVLPAPGTFVQSIGDRGEIQIVAMGRLDEQKGFDILLKAFVRVGARFPKCSLTVWGEGPSRRRLEELREELGLTGQVRFPGRTTNPYDVFSKADVFVLSSRYEGFPNALCEAMACGVPVISTDCPSGPGTIIQQGVNGILVPTENHERLAEEMLRLLENEPERVRLGHSAQDIVERFSLQKVADAWENILQRCCVRESGDARRHAEAAFDSGANPQTSIRK